MSDNVSKSVGRAFAVLELLRAQRRPLTASAIQRELQVPQPSLRALLAKLVDLGYLALDPPTRTYFPTPKLAALGGGVTAEPEADASWRQAIDRIAADTGETASLCVARDLDLEVLYARMADHPVALQLRAGRGDALWRSAAGRLLLSAYDEKDVQDLLERQAQREPSAARRRSVLKLGAELDRLRKRDSLTAYDLHLKGVGAVCVRTRLHSQAAVVAVAGVNDRIRSGERAIRATIRRHLDSLA